jgi:hypothetical protein
LREARKVGNFTAICDPIVWKMLEPRRLTILWTSATCYRDSFTFTLRLRTADETRRQKVLNRRCRVWTATEIVAN